MANDPSNDELHQALSSMTHDPEPSVRANAAVSLAKFKDPAARPTLHDMLAAPNASSDQQWEALRALKVIGTKEDLPMIVRFENSSEKRIRDAAQEAAQSINDRP